MIDRYLIRYFLAVIDHGNFSRAAAACRVSQPTLSVGIAKLENMLGSPLFIRSNQRVELTSGGARFQVHARRIEREFHLAVKAIADEHPSSTLRVGVLTSIPGDILAEAGRHFAPEMDIEQLEFIPGTERELTGHLAKGRIDIAVTLVERGGDRFREEIVLREGYALAMAETHEFAGYPSIRADELASDVMIVRRHCEALSETSRFFTEHGVRPHFSFRSTNDERVLMMVSAGIGITIMPDSYKWPGVVRPKLAGFKARRSLGFAFAHHAEDLAMTRPIAMEAIAAALRARAR